MIFLANSHKPSILNHKCIHVIWTDLTNGLKSTEQFYFKFWSTSLPSCCKKAVFKAHSSHIHLCALMDLISREVQVKCSMYSHHQVENKKFIQSIHMAPCGTNLTPIDSLLFNIQIHLMHTSSIPRIVFWI